jgi:phosphoglycolate phosphatase
MTRLPETRHALVVWDFNGTLIDDVELVVRSVNVQLAKRRLPLLTVERYRELFGFPVADYYRRIGLDPSAESMEVLSSEFHDAYVPGLMGCPLHAGVVDALERFRALGERQFVLSAMEEGLLRLAIEHLGIAEFFEAVYGLAHLEADSKITRGRELLANHDIRPETGLLIGDTDHDAEVAAALGLSVVLIAQGHQSEERLRKMDRPVYRSVRDWYRADRMGNAHSKST